MKVQKYIGTKIIQAEPMTVEEYNEQIRPLVYSGEDRNGYKVVYEDGYVSWSPKDVFEKSYRPTDNMSFGLAIEALKKGLRVARKGWNGKGMFLYLVRGRSVDKEFTVNEASIQPIFDNTDVAHFNSHIDMKTADGSVCVGWLASQTDMLADDWVVVQ